MAYTMLWYFNLFTQLMQKNLLLLCGATPVDTPDVLNFPSDVKSLIIYLSEVTSEDAFSDSKFNEQQVPAWLPTNLKE